MIAKTFVRNKFLKKTRISKFKQYKLYELICIVNKILKIIQDSNLK